MNVYLFPTEYEAEPFRHLRPDAEIIITGVGMAATAAAIVALDRRKHLVASDVVVLAGVAGSYSDDIAVGEVVEVESEQCVELPERFRQRYYQRVSHTSLRRVASNTVHRAAAEQADAGVENMEGAALFALAEVIGFAAVELRAVSNRVGESFDKWSMQEAVEALARELAKLEDGK